MVGRPYVFSGPTSPASSERPAYDTMGLNTARPRSAPLPTANTPRHAPPPLEKRATVTEPVSIPAKSSSRPAQPSYVAQVTRSSGQRDVSKSRRASNKSDSKPVPSAVAALLAVTAIPAQRRHSSRKRSDPNTRRVSVDNLVKEWKQEASKAPPSPIKSPLDILLEPADEDNEKALADDVLDLSLESEKESDSDDPPRTARSISSSSIGSTPSLDAECRTVSSYNSPRPPSIQSRRSAEKKEKIQLSSSSRECIEDHPLRPESPNEAEFWDLKQASPLMPKQKPRSTFFKSNLTASFQALKSAAKSLSNFAAPSIPSDDLLTRSLLGSKFASEMRPNFHGAADPALRRYLNPAPTTPFSSSCPDFTTLLQDALGGPTAPHPSAGPQAPMIQMQTYKRSSKRSRSAPPPEVLPAERAEATMLSSGPVAVRQREPRENSDFLRVVVLEMNMRRSGKLDAKGFGRARVWLPPRKNGSVECGSLKNGIPARWVATSRNDSPSKI